MTSIAAVSVLLVLSYYLFLLLKDMELFKAMILQSFMWIPIVVGAAITGLIEFLPKIITRSKKKKWGILQDYNTLVFMAYLK